MDSSAEFLTTILSMALPIIIVILVVVIRATRPASGQGNGKINPGNLFHTEGRDPNLYVRNGEQKYSREVHEIHMGDRQEVLNFKLDQLKNLYSNGMMERDEYIERRNTIEEDYRNGDPI